MTEKLLNQSSSISLNRDIALYLIRSKELTDRLKIHGDFIDRAEIKESVHPAALFRDQIKNHPLAVTDSSVRNSVLSILVRGFDYLHIDQSVIYQQIKEISLADFSEALTVAFWSVCKRLSPIWYKNNILQDVSSFYLSYALTLVSAKELLRLMLEADRMNVQGETVTFEKLLNAVEMVATGEYDDQPAGWILQLA